MSVSGASEEMAVIWIGERTRPRVLAMASSPLRTFSGVAILLLIQLRCFGEAAEMFTRAACVP
jgi:hypothetical protein